MSEPLLGTQLNVKKEQAVKVTIPESYNPIQSSAVFSEFARRLSRIEQEVKLSAGVDRITSQIALSPDAMLIQSSKIAIVGEVTFADWQRDISGASTGVIDPSITQIRGGVIRTGKVISLDGQSWLDLDASGTTAFIKCRSSIAINADGTFVFGATSGKQLVWNGTNLTIENSALLGSTPVSTVVSGASDGTTAIATKLNKGASDILSGNIEVQTSGGLRAGTITWDSSGNLTGGSGIAITAKGIVGAASGIATFTIDSTTGAATFAGTLTAANIYSGGTVNFQGSTSPGLIQFYSGATGLRNAYILGSHNSFTYGGPEIVGFAIFSNETAESNLAERYVRSGDTTLIAGNSSGNVPISNGSVCSNLNADMVDGVHIGSVSTGASIATVDTTNKPGANSTNAWLSMTVGGTTYYLPAWT